MALKARFDHVISIAHLALPVGGKMFRRDTPGAPPAFVRGGQDVLLYHNSILQFAWFPANGKMYDC